MIDINTLIMQSDTRRPDRPRPIDRERERASISRITRGNF